MHFLAVPNIARSCICEALRSNTSLRKVSMTVEDEQPVLDIVRALDGHRGLKCLFLKTKTESALMDNVIRILVTSKICQLEELQIMGGYSFNICCLMMTTDGLVQTLAENTSLKSFRTNWKLMGGIVSRSCLVLCIRIQP